jgi:hypothetical protein
MIVRFIYFLLLYWSNYLGVAHEYYVGGHDRKEKRGKQPLGRRQYRNLPGVVAGFCYSTTPL